MSNILVEFVKAYGKYNMGETAGFDRVVAEKLEAEKVAKIVGGVKGIDLKLTPAVNTEEVQEMIAEGRAELEEKADALNVRTEEMDAAQASLTEWEDALKVREKAVDDLAKLSEAIDTGNSDNTSKPPKQGGK